VRSSGGDVRVTSAAEIAKIMVGGRRTIEGEEGSAHVQSLGRETIDEEGGGGKSIFPIDGWHGGLEE
jgi:hypothetical protein